MTGLQVAPTAPCSMEYVSSDSVAESFHKQVGVVCVISYKGLLYATGFSRVLITLLRYFSGYINTLIAFFSSHRRKAVCQSDMGSRVEIRSFSRTRPSA